MRTTKQPSSDKQPLLAALELDINTPLETADATAATPENNNKTENKTAPYTDLDYLIKRGMVVESPFNKITDFVERIKSVVEIFNFGIKRRHTKPAPWLNTLFGIGVFIPPGHVRLIQRNNAPELVLSENIALRQIFYLQPY